MWAAQIAGTGNDTGQAVATDPSGNVFVTGLYGAALTLYNAAGVSNAALAFTGGYDAFLAKYSSNGTVLWAARIAGTTTSDDRGYGVATDPSGNVFVTGYYSAALTLYNSSGVSNAALAFTGGQDAFLAKYDSNGTVVWAAQIAGTTTSGDAGQAVATDSSGNVFVTGIYSRALTLYNATSVGGAYSNTLAFTGGTYDAFLAKYSSTGTVLWAARIASTGDDAGYGVATDSSGNVFVTGYYTSTTAITLSNAGGTASSYTLPISANFGSGNTQFIVSYTSAGNVSGAIAVRTDNPTDLSVGQGIAVSGTNMYTTGYYKSRGLTTLQASGYAYPTASAGGTLSLPYTGGNDVFVAKYGPYGNTVWAARIASTGAVDDVGYGVATDPSGNVFVTGYYRAALTLYNSSGVSNASLAFTGGVDAFIAKYSSTGTVLWAAQIAGTSTDQGNAVATDSSGNVFVTGYYGAALTLSNATTVGGAYGNTLANTGSLDVFLAKYSSTGTVLWAARIAGTTTSFDVGYGVATDSSGNVFVTGYYQAALTLYNSSGVSNASLAFTGGQDAFIAKYDSNGAVSWAARIAGTTTSFDVGYGVATDSSGNVFVTGQYEAALTLYNSSGVSNAALAFTGGQDVFLAKYSSTGSVLWAARIAGTTTSSDIGFGVATDSSGNVFVTGQYGAALTLYNAAGVSNAALAFTGGIDVFLAKYSSTGTVVWAAQIAGGGNDRAYGIATDSSGNVFVTGNYTDTLTLYNSSGVSNAALAFTGGTDVFLAKYSSTGTVVWAAQITGTTTSVDIGQAVATDSNGNVVVTGYYNAALSLYNAV